MNSPFFDTNSYFIDEKVNLFGFENKYKVYNDKGEQIGTINQKLSIGQKLLRLLISKGVMPFKLEIRDNDEQIIATISRGWTIFLSKIIITDAKENVIGSIKQKFKLLKQRFLINNRADELVAVIQGNWSSWEFSITDTSEKEIGTISKKWAGAMKELFTSADKYIVTINPDFTYSSSKIAVVASAIAVDMILKESK